MYINWVWSGKWLPVKWPNIKVRVCWVYCHVLEKNSQGYTLTWFVWQRQLLFPDVNSQGMGYASLSRPPPGKTLSPHGLDRNSKMCHMWDRQELRRLDIHKLHDKELKEFQSGLAVHKNALSNFTNGIANLRRENTDLFQRKGLRLDFIKDKLFVFEWLLDVIACLLLLTLCSSCRNSWPGWLRLVLNSEWLPSTGHAGCRFVVWPAWIEVRGNFIWTCVSTNRDPSHFVMCATCECFR